MAQVRALTWSASFDLHRHWSCANLLAALMKVHRLCGGRTEIRRGGTQPKVSTDFLTSIKRISQLHGSGNFTLIYFNANPRHICLIERCDRLTFIVAGEDRQVQWGQGHLFTSLPHYSWLMMPNLWAKLLTSWRSLIIKWIYYHGRINDPLLHSEDPPPSNKPKDSRLRR